MDSDQPPDFKAGLIGLNLDVMHALDLQVIQEAILTVQKLLDKEHPIVYDVQRNLIAILKLKIPKERFLARKDLEMLASSPNTNLNAMADLEHVYRELDRTKDADKWRKKIDAIMTSKLISDIKNKQACLLEQGYIILVERTLINQKALENRITDLTKILTTERERSAGTRKKTLERGIHHQMQVLRSVRNANDEGKHDRHLSRKGSSLQKFEIALSIYSKSQLDIIWHYYHAKALNQYYDTLENISSSDDELVGEMEIVTKTAVEKFWSISQYNFYHDIELKRIVARSYAYLGHIFTKRQRLVERRISDYQVSKKSYFKKLLSEPLLSLEKAYKLCSRDTVVLTRYGRSLWNKTYHLQNIEEKRILLEDANKFLSFCLDIDQTRNWFARSSRMVVKIELSTIAMKSNKQLALKLLKEARLDGIECFKSQCTQKDMVKLAEVCQKLAKFPMISKYGPDFVRYDSHLHEALDYLFYGMSLGDGPDFHWMYRKASCLYDLGEFREAIEWQKKSWLLSNQSHTMAFYVLCMFTITLISHEYDFKVIKEFLYVLSYGKNKYSEKFDGLMIKFMQVKQNEVLNGLLQKVVNEEVQLRKQEKEILQVCICIWKGMSLSQECTNQLSIAETKLNKKEEIKDTKYELLEIFHTPSLRLSFEQLQPCSPDHEYDFFISHSHKDVDWVTNILLPNLESKFDDNDVAFKGCIADRDFIPGKSILSNIVDFIGRSYKVILVLTEHFVSSNWCDYEADQAIMKELNLKSNGEDDANASDYNCVIPIMLEPCKVPLKICNLNYIDMNIESDFVKEIMRLKKALLPQDT